MASKKPIYEPRTPEQIKVDEAKKKAKKSGDNPQS